MKFPIKGLGSLMQGEKSLDKHSKVLNMCSIRRMKSWIKLYKDALDLEKLRTKESERACTLLNYQLEQADIRIQTLEGMDQDAAYMLLANECRY